ncbi:MAG: hybrid sensor histidine kinase/response regulator [Magnetococcales bacterium]|nr:hybrid sensor histidine kinase/response regulator [Magnetococcales bacterium]MBF0151449.1 hybrid sensor histidine kinase/response regulator [Magnetococcales bacterium]MBF0174416.1 hybrid sensor histidine kinase/response regulator [Magnetococcales bacterium]
MIMEDEQERILVVDDEKTNIDVMVGLLSNEFRVLVAKDGLQALKRTRSAPIPDLILLDIIMPEMDGFEVCRQLKGDPSTSGIPIMFITGMNNPADETRGLQLGAVDFVRKPFNPSVVLARVHTHLELSRQRKRLLELNNLKNKFLGMAAHDLRNPLNSICGMSDILLNLQLDEQEQRRFITSIHHVGMQMRNLINDLLDVSVIESGRFNLSLQPDRLERVILSRVELFRFELEKKSIHIDAQLAETGMACFDDDRLSQVVDNLIANAIKFSNPGARITLRTGTEDGKVWFSVEDQGPGISDDDRTRMFGAFQKLSARPTGKEKSIGLGLSIVKKIVDAHRGEIRVASEMGKGSIFTVVIPVDKEQ